MGGLHHRGSERPRRRSPAVSRCIQGASRGHRRRVRVQFSVHSTISALEPAPTTGALATRGAAGKGKLLFKAYTTTCANRARCCAWGAICCPPASASSRAEPRRIQRTGEIPRTRFNAKMTPHRVLGATKFDFEAIRKIKNSVEGATINDVMLAIVSGALRKYLDQKASCRSAPGYRLPGQCPR